MNRLGDYGETTLDIGLCYREHHEETTPVSQYIFQEIDDHSIHDYEGHRRLIKGWFRERATFHEVNNPLQGVHHFRLYISGLTPLVTAFLSIWHTETQLYFYNGRGRRVKVSLSLMHYNPKEQEWMEEVYS